MRETFDATRSLTTGVLILALALLSGAVPAHSQVGGEWQATFSGQIHNVDRVPTLQSVDATADLTIEVVDGLLLIDIGIIDGALPASRWKARGGAGGFVASHSDSGQARVLHGSVEGDRIDGEMLIARTGEATIPGWTELTFTATRGAGTEVAAETETETEAEESASRRRFRPPIARRPSLSQVPDRRDLLRERRPRLTPPAADTVAEESAEDATFEMDLIDATEPVAPTDRQQVRFGLRAEAPPGVDVERVELFVDGEKVHSADGAVIDVALGPYPEGRVSYSLVAWSADGARAESGRRSLSVRSAGSAVVSGTITGRRDLVSNVDLVDENETTVERTDLDNAGRFSFRNLPTGVFWVFVNDEKREARIRVTNGSPEIHSDGRSSYRVDFHVE